MGVPLLRLCCGGDGEGFFGVSFGRRCLVHPLPCGGLLLGCRWRIGLNRD